MAYTRRVSDSSHEHSQNTPLVLTGEEETTSRPTIFRERVLAIS